MSKPEERATMPRRLVDDICDEQRRRWGQGERILVEAYLHKLPALGADSGAILDLIYNEIVLREKAGERPQQQEYAQRFPHLSAEIAMQFEVDRGLDWQAVIGASSVDDDGLDSRPIREPSGGAPFPMLPGYALAGLLGRGATGVVYKARQIKQDRSVAVKVVLAGMPRQTAALAQLRAEAGKVASLHHPNLCPIHEIGVDEGRLFIAQERVEGSLARRQADAPISTLDAAQWLATLAQTMHDIHRLSIVHGNLTPANILMSYNGILKITDIGLARFTDPLPRRGWSCRPPEQADGNRDARNVAGDVYGLGAILYALLVGRPPFADGTGVQALHEEPPPPSQLRPDIPLDLETICLRCLQPEPGKRYASAAELGDDLMAFLAGRPIQARRPGFLSRWARSLRRPGAGNPDDAHLLAAARLRVERLQLTLDLTRRLMRVKGRGELIRLLAETAAWLTDAEQVTVFLTDAERKELWAPISRGIEVDELRQPFDAGIGGIVASTGAPVNLADAHADSRFDPDNARRTGVKTRTLLALPLTAGDTVLGVVQAINKRDGAFSAEDVEALSALLESAAIAFERCHDVNRPVTKPNP
jgi:tRNA A-37 threonylcarbamoyl transferase component Bud32